MRFCPEDEYFSHHVEQLLGICIRFFEPSGPVSVQYYNVDNCTTISFSEKKTPLTMYCRKIKAAFTELNSHVLNTWVKYKCLYNWFSSFVWLLDLTCPISPQAKDFSKEQLTLLNSAPSIMLFTRRQLHVFIKLDISESCGFYNVPVVVHKSDEEWVEGIQVSYQYSELVHDEKLCLCNFPSSLCFAVFFIHQNNSCSLRTKQHRFF